MFSANVTPISKVPFWIVIWRKIRFGGFAFLYNVADYGISQIIVSKLHEMRYQ